MVSKATTVASLIIPGDGPPGEAMRNGKFSMTWAGTTVTKFQEAEIPRLEDPGMQLPTLYLHFLDADFRIKDGDLDRAMRSGNDMDEVIIKLPAKYLSPEFAAECKDLKDDVEEVIKALRCQGECLVSSSRKADPGILFFSLRTARAKSKLSLDRKAFGIPEDADQYLFVKNHSSGVHFDDRCREAINKCIGSLSEVGSPDAVKFCIFLKVFYEGGFAYNKKLKMGDRGYLPVNVGTAAIHAEPAFAGQQGIVTGHPYKLPATFLPFTETAPISIDAIKSMSEYHGRYGFAFTRVVFVWEGDKWEESKTLDFCSILPHGGFFYVPSSLRDHQDKGGLVYSFGDVAASGGYA